MCVNPYHISIAVRELDLFLANFIFTTDPSKGRIKEQGIIATNSTSTNETNLDDDDQAVEGIWGTDVFSAYELKILTRRKLTVFFRRDLYTHAIKLHLKKQHAVYRTEKG